MNVTTIGIDLAKSVFQLHGVDGDGAVVFRRKLRRSAVLDLPLLAIVFSRCDRAARPTITPGRESAVSNQSRKDERNESR